MAGSIMNQIFVKKNIRYICVSSYADFFQHPCQGSLVREAFRIEMNYFKPYFLLFLKQLAVIYLPQVKPTINCHAVSQH